MSNDETWMRMALQEAQRGVGRTAPNPPVGCVIVKDGVFIGSGWHKRAGMPHAEREAMADVRETHGEMALRGATAYVTLEPCSTQGRTPPCVDGLYEAGITRVVYASVDPNPAHAGRARRMLEARGVEVTEGVCEREAQHLLRHFSKVQIAGLPWVLVKTAMSLDGRITRMAGESPWLSGAEALRVVQELRSQCDMILTSGETVRRDKPALTIRDAALLDGREQPWRMILTNRPESLPTDAPVMCDAYRERTLIRSGSIESALRHAVVEQGVTSVMVEAGGTFNAELFRLGLVDEVVFFLTPWITGGLPAVGGTGLPEIRTHSIEWRRCGDDMMMRALVAKEISP
jgi:diaminohydroxyphosphoribosylaminopyrimidine deaminase/5-amino-6-(5-phosphoribosylamino)uracil reductase